MTYRNLSDEADTAPQTPPLDYADLLTRASNVIAEHAVMRHWQQDALLPMLARAHLDLTARLADITADRDRFRAMLRHVSIDRFEKSPLKTLIGGNCTLCGSTWDFDQAEAHKPNCVLASPPEEPKP